MSISISDTWQAYESTETVNMPAGEQGILSFTSGGIIPVTTYYDLVELFTAD